MYHITDTKLFFYIVATNIPALVTACDEVLYAFIIDLRLHSSLFHCFWSVCHQKIRSVLEPSENHLGAKSELYGGWSMRALWANGPYFLDDLRIWNKSYKQECCLHLGYDAVYSGRSCRISEGTLSSEKTVHLEQITLHHIPEGRVVRSHREYREFWAGDGRYMT